MPVSGVAVAEMAAGGVLVYSGIKGYTLADTFASLVKGTTPADTEQIDTQSAASSSAIASAASGSSSSTGSGSPSVPSGAYAAIGSKSAQQALSNAAAAYGWNTGAEWTALTNIEMREAGFNPSATNPSSGAYGLGQALGHGTSSTRGSVTNEYGGYGVSDSVAQAANSGDAGAQAIWMCAYIKVVYGDPVKAWAHEQSAGWY